MKKQKMLAMVCAAVLVFSVSGCGNTGSSGEEENGQVSKETEDVQDQTETKKDGELTIAWSCADLSNQFQVTLTDSIKEAVAGMGAKYLEGDGANDASKQVSQVENFITQGADLIMISPADSDACAPAVTAANEAGIPIMIVNCKIANQENATCYVGSDDTQAGELEMEYIADQLGGKGNIVVLQGLDGRDATVKRTDGINAVLENYPDIKILAMQPADWSVELGMSTVENWLQTMEFDAVVSQNDEMALGAVQALKANGKEDILVIGVDGIEDGLKAVKTGDMIATVLQDAPSIAKKAGEVAEKILAGETVEPEYIVPFQVIDKNNIDQYYTE
jgi:inositol transport system substrate-binding protein